MTIDWFTFVAQIINFLVLIWLLQRFLYAPVVRAMAERESQIAQRFADAEAAQAEADECRSEYTKKQEELAQARESMLAKAGCDVDAWRDEQLRQARAEVDEDRRKWLEDLAREKHTLLRELQLDVTQHAVDLGRQVLQQLADQSLQSRLVDQLIDQLRATDVDSLQESDGAAATAVVIESSHELTADDQARLSQALKEFNGGIEFRTNPQLVCGIELQMPGHRLSWNLREALAEVESDLIDAIEETLPVGAGQAADSGSTEGTQA